MAAPAPAAIPLPEFTPTYRQEALSKAIDAVKGDEAKLAAVRAALGVEAGKPLSTADEINSACGAWLSPDKDLHELLTKLEAATQGAFPGSPTGFRFDYSDDALKSLAAEIIHRSKRVLDGIAAIKPTLPGENRKPRHTFANTIGAMSENDRIVDFWSNSITFLGHVSPNKATRDVCSEMEKVMSAFEVSQSMRVDLYESFQVFEQTDEAQELTGEAARLLAYTLRDFRRNGLALPLEKRQRVEAIKKRMSELGITFNKNLGEENSEFEFSAEELKGVPADQLDRFPKSKTNPDKYVVTLKYPSYFPVMDICSVASTRQKLEYEFTRRCIDSNTPILQELIALRTEQASILGYPNHAAYVLEIRMAKSPEKVGPFLRELSAKLNPLMEDELAYWRELKAEEARANGDPNAKAADQVIHPYDFRYLIRLSELRKYKVDDQAIKQYFPMSVVTKGLLDIYQRTLGFVFEEVDRAVHVAWHEEVKLFVVKDADTSKVRGYFYLDLYPREGKYGHAAVWGLKAGCATENGGRQLPVAGMVANFTKPTQSQPSLLTHQEVVTYFHEFGHVMHQICSEVTFPRFAGTAVERDFVEAPSQMLENWCYEEEPLLLMSGLASDPSQKMPKHLLDSIVASKKANAGLFNKRQCILGLFDQYIHTHGNECSDISKVYEQICRENWNIVPTPGTNFAAGFGHIAGGYDAQYYGYMWSEVYSADMFESRFKAEGLLNTAAGLSYRKEIISRGGSIDASEMIKNFLGREPNDKAFLRSKGLSV